MKRPFLIILLIIVPLLVLDAQDLIILRNGDDILCKVEKLDNGEVTYKSDGVTETLPVTQIYLIKYASRGNAFFSETGDATYRTKVPKSSKKDILIYLCSGSEIKASELEIKSETLQYQEPKNSLAPKTSEEWIPISKRDVFLIRYPDGTKDVINNLQKKDGQIRIDDVPKCKHPFIPINKEFGYSVEAELKLNDDNDFSVIIYDLDRVYIYYKTTDWLDGPIYRMNRNKIKSIIKKQALL